MAISRERDCPGLDERGKVAVILLKGGTRGLEGERVFMMTV